MPGILRNKNPTTSPPESPPPSPPAQAPATATAPTTNTLSPSSSYSSNQITAQLTISQSDPETPRYKTQEITTLLKKLNKLKNPVSTFNAAGLNGFFAVKANNSTFTLHEDRQQVNKCIEKKIENGQTYLEPSETWNYNDFINLLNEEIGRSHFSQPIQPVYAPTTNSSSVVYPPQAYGLTLPYGGQPVQPWQPTLHQPAMSFGGQYPYQQPSPYYATAIPPTYNSTTLSTIHGGQITYPSNFLHTVPGLSLNPHRQAYSSPVLNTTFTALPYGAVGGASFGTGYQMSGQGYGVPYRTPLKMSSIIPGTTVCNASNMSMVVGSCFVTPR
jgi:hypothetical protein